MHRELSGSPVAGAISPRSSTPNPPNPEGKIQFFVSEFRGMNPKWHQEQAFIDDDALWQLKEDGGVRLIVSFQDVMSAHMDEKDGVWTIKITANYKERKVGIKRSLSAPVVDLLTGHNGRRQKDIILSSNKHSDANFIFQRCLIHAPAKPAAPGAPAAAGAGHH
eukprot:tig00001038_g6515.t1